MTILPIPLAFHAEDQADAEAQAMAWASKEAKITTARVSEAVRRLGTTRWTVTLEVTMQGEPEQLTLGPA